MKTWEMIEELSKNPDKKFKNQRGEEIRLLPDNDLYFGGENGYNFISITDEWEEVKDPVNFVDVLRESNNKSIRFKLEHNLFIDHVSDRKFTLSVFLNYIGHEYISSDVADILLNGKFYIED